QAANPGTTIGLSVFDTQTVIDLVGRRELELGVVGAARRQRSVVFEPFFRDEVVLAVPPAHPFAGRTVTLDELREEPLIVMQDGAGVRQVIEDELRAAGWRASGSRDRLLGSRRARVGARGGRLGAAVRRRERALGQARAPGGALDRGALASDRRRRGGGARRRRRARGRRRERDRPR